MFLLGFLPLTLAGFAVAGRLGPDWAKAWLIAASVLFYAAATPRFLPLLLASVAGNLLLLRLIAASGRRDALAALGVGLNLAVLGWFKYAAPVAGLDAGLPLGISFFTFTQIGCLLSQAISDTPPPRVADQALFVLFFPSLIAGPILNPREMLPQFSRPGGWGLTADNLATGAGFFLIGLLKKTLLADPLSPIVAAGFADPAALSLLPAWQAATAWSLQLYFDFSGYTDMAIGLAWMFGFRFPDNFEQPYRARSVIQYWQRWHMSLTRFLMANVHAPLTLAILRRRRARPADQPRRAADGGRLRDDDRRAGPADNHPGRRVARAGIDVPAVRSAAWRVSAGQPRVAPVAGAAAARFRFGRADAWRGPGGCGAVSVSHRRGRRVDAGRHGGMARGRRRRRSARVARYALDRRPLCDYLVRPQHAPVHAGRSCQPADLASDAALGGGDGVRRDPGAAGVRRDRRIRVFPLLMRYPRLMAISAAVSFGLVWLWIVTMPMAFMDPEYPSWRAKLIMLDRCDLGDAIILGDSRAAADIIPARLPIKATNLAVGGGEPIEAYVALRRALRCGRLPRLAIVSFDPGHFVRPDLFWERSVRFGLIDSAAVADLRATSLRIGDLSVYAAHAPGGLPLRLRDALERIRFPPLYFASLAHSAGVLRWPRNRRTLAATLEARGQYAFGTDDGSDAVAFDGHLPAFRPLPILDHYFNRMLDLLNAHGIETRFIDMPVNEATWQAEHPAMRAGFAAYLAGYEHRYPVFHVADDPPPHWPDRFFGDQFCHLNPAGAERFSAELAQRLQEAPPSTQNEAQNGWLSDTGRDASARVAPISKRGS